LVTKSMTIDYYTSPELIDGAVDEMINAISSDSLLTALEMEARVAKKGLWSEPYPVPPWVWRKMKKAGKKI